MNKIRIIYKLVFAGLGLSAVIYEIIKLLGEGGFDGGAYFSQYTTQTNLFASALLLMSAVFLSKNRTSRILEYLRGASTVYLVTTGIAFGLLLTKYITNVTDIPWSNFTLHYIMPAAIIIDWFLDQPKAVIYFKKALTWMIYPIAYIIYTMVRGAVTGVYTYPFLNPDNSSLAKIGATIAGLLLMVLALAYLISRFGPEKSAKS